MFAFTGLKKLYHELIHSHASTEDVSYGFAIGIFVSMTPTIGFQSFVALGLAALFRKNELAALIGVWFTNPLTAFPITYFNFKVGQLIYTGSLKTEFTPNSLKDLLDLGGDLLIPLWIGSIVVGIISGFIAYFVSKKFHPALRKKRQELQTKIGQKLHSHHDHKNNNS